MSVITPFKLVALRSDTLRSSLHHRFIRPEPATKLTLECGTWDELPQRVILSPTSQNRWSWLFHSRFAVSKRSHGSTAFRGDPARNRLPYLELASICNQVVVTGAKDLVAGCLRTSVAHVNNRAGRDPVDYDLERRLRFCG